MCLIPVLSAGLGVLGTGAVPLGWACLVSLPGCAWYRSRLMDWVCLVPELSIGLGVLDT